MQSSPNHAAWQLGPVSAAGRVATVALAGLVVDSAFLWQSISLLAAIALTALPLVVAIRVIRAFPDSLEAAASTFVAAVALAGGVLWSNQFANPQLKSAVAIAASLSIAGLAALAFGWLQNRSSDESAIEIAEPAPVRVRARTPRRYR